MKAVTVARIAAKFSDYLEASRKQPVLVTENGKPVAILLAVQNEAEAKQFAAHRVRSLRSVFQEAHEQIERGEGIASGEFWKQVKQTRRNKQASVRNKKA